MYARGNMLGTGTGFIALSARGPTLITNRHNVTGRHNGTDRLLSPTGAAPDEIAVTCSEAGKLAGYWTQIRIPLFGSRGRLWFEHPTLGATADFVAIPLKDVDHVQLFPYDVGEPFPAMSYGPAELVSVVGFPFDIAASGSLAVWATGFVASEPEVDFEGLPIFLIDCRSRPGQSGSPVIAHRSGAIRFKNNMAGLGAGTTTNFLGIYSGRVQSDSDIGVVWKRSAVKQLVDSIPPL